MLKKSIKLFIYYTEFISMGGKESEFADTLRDWQQKISVQQEQKESLQALTAENNRLRVWIESFF